MAGPPVDFPGGMNHRRPISLIDRVIGRPVSWRRRSPVGRTMAAKARESASDGPGARAVCPAPQPAQGQVYAARMPPKGRERGQVPSGIRTRAEDRRRASRPWRYGQTSNETSNGLQPGGARSGADLRKRSDSRLSRIVPGPRSLLRQSQAGEHEGKRLPAEDCGIISWVGHPVDIESCGLTRWTRTRAARLELSAAGPGPGSANPVETSRWSGRFGIAPFSSAENNIGSSRWGRALHSTCHRESSTHSEKFPGPRATSRTTLRKQTVRGGPRRSHVRSAPVARAALIRARSLGSRKAMLHATCRREGRAHNTCRSSITPLTSVAAGSYSRDSSRRQATPQP